MTSTDVLRRWVERSRKSQELHAKAKKLLPLGVESHYRAIDPNPIFIERAQGSRIWDADGNEYLDFGLCFGALFVGHAHPKILEAVNAQMKEGSMYTMPHRHDIDLAENLLSRFPMDLVRFTNSGTEATMHAIRTARGYTKRNKIIKFEGGFHGCHDYVLASTKPDLKEIGEPSAPNLVPGSLGIPEETLNNTLIAGFNNLESVERLFKKYPGQIAAVISEPVMMNTGVCLPQDDFLQKLLDVCHQNGALLILDEVKTGAKIAWGGACETYKLKPDLICLAKTIGGGLPLGAFGGKKEVMSVLENFSVSHVGTYNGNPLCIKAGAVTCRDILTKDVYPKTQALNKRLMSGYADIMKKNRLPWHMAEIGPIGTVHFTPEQVRDYRTWAQTNKEIWKRYWFGMCNEGIIPTPYGWDEQWTISVQHTQADIDRHLAVFEKIAPTLVP
ncbi:MAG: glutamate-1-semialdehyde 2,1-aminomutase [Elusimicrobia bacterium]|nr:glutamate-1-semialdehyde 2,1-aminomutase [Elusimicrobiota bacterium]